jgi:hypothetical protein
LHERQFRPDGVAREQGARRSHINASCITNEELERDDIPKAENSKSTVLREPSDLPSSSRLLVLFAAVAGLVTLVWFAFLVWLVLKTLSLL